MGDYPAAKGLPDAGLTLAAAPKDNAPPSWQAARIRSGIAARAAAKNRGKVAQLVRARHS